MPARKLTPPGVATMLQLVPSQCSVNVPRSWCPTARTAGAESQLVVGCRGAAVRLGLVPGWADHPR